jgi:hypothetical protein
MSVGISDIRTVPVGEDLTKEDIRCQIIRGMEQAHRADVKLASPSTVLLTGEYAVLNSAGKAVRSSATPLGESFLVFSGTDRFDARATGNITLIMSFGQIVKSSVYDTGAVYAVGSYLTVKDLGAGESKLTLRSGVEPRIGRVLEVGTGYLVYQILSGV